MLEELKGNQKMDTTMAFKWDSSKKQELIDFCVEHKLSTGKVMRTGVENILSELKAEVKQPELNIVDSGKELRKLFKIKGKDGVMSIITSVLTVNGNRLRFEMSGYEGNTGECTIHNQMILNLFAKFGIYDYSNMLCLDFYKGCPSLVIVYDYYTPTIHIDEDYMNGLGTREIIYEILKRTVLSGKPNRRRG